MAHIVQPVTQKWFTNVAIVQYVVNGQHFEVACYANKIAAYRNGAEKDINEVLQAQAIFSDAVKGELQSSEALQNAFGTHNLASICRTIVTNGRVQLSELERTVELSRRFLEIASIVALRLTNPVTGAAYPRALIESTMRNDLHYRVTTQPASAQAANVIRQLETLLNTKLAQSAQLSIELPLDNAKDCLAKSVNEYGIRIDLESFILEGWACFFTATVDIKQYRPICDFLKEATGGLAHISLKGTSSFKMK